MPWSFSDASSNSVKGVEGGRKAAASASSAPFISPHPKVQKPKDLPGTEWWGTVLRNSLEHKRLKLGPQKRPIIFESSLSGTLSEVPLFEATHLTSSFIVVGMLIFRLVVHLLTKISDDFISPRRLENLHIDFDCVICCDSKPDASAFIIANRHGKVTHILTDIHDHINGNGCCKAAGHHQCELPKKRPDLLSISLNCQAHSGMRYKKGATRKTSADSNHPGYQVNMELVPMLVQARSPLGVLIEIVISFKSAKDNEGNSAFEKFVKIMQDSGLEGWAAVESNS